MIGINDLHITAECWEWIIKHTEEFEYFKARSVKNDFIVSKESQSKFYIESALRNTEHKRYYDSIAYQAVNCINKTENDLKIIYAFKENKLYAIIAFNFDNEHYEYYAFIGKYDRITTAIFDVFKYIWEQEKAK